MPVRCKDGALGELADLVVDPATRRVTHLVVQLLHGSTVGPRLVPVEWAEGSEEQQVIALRCTTEDFSGLDAVRELAYDRLRGVPVDDEDWDVGIVDVLAAPSFYSSELGMPSYADVATSFDRIPKDEVELRRSSPVQSCDGRGLGHVEALIIDGQDTVTHFVLQSRHLWARRNVKVPVSAIKAMDTDVVTIVLTKAQVRALPVEEARRG